MSIYSRACLFVVLVGNVSSETLERSLVKLPYWRGDGRNHLILHVTRGSDGGPPFAIPHVARAMLAQSSANDITFRPNFDLLIPPAMGPPGGTISNIQGLKKQNFFI
jgi:alpha-1,4-N-acetylglucosaminyltransferase EXTL3